MTQDFLLRQDEDGVYDLRIADRDFETVDGFETAILTSLFTDARAPASAVERATDRRGWTGDILTAAEGRSLGSLLWTYEQSRLTQDIRNQIAVAAERALRWMVQDGEARSVSAEVIGGDVRSVSLQIKITTIGGDVQSYVVLWRNTRGANIS